MCNNDELEISVVSPFVDDATKMDQIWLTWSLRHDLLDKATRQCFNVGSIEGISRLIKG
jgi:hypothetical protein